MATDMGLEVSYFDIEDDELAGATGRCFSYVRAGEQIAYLDVYADDTAVVTVFKPYEGTSRRYSRRPKRRAEGILDRFLRADGYHGGSLDARERDY